MQVLRARLLELAEQRARRRALSVERRAQVGGGGRGEKIRTYNFKENRVTDHRIGFTIYRLADVLAGDLDDVVAALAADERARQLAERPDRDRRAVGDVAAQLLAETDAPPSAIARRPAGCARWRAAPIGSRTCSGRAGDRAAWSPTSTRWSPATVAGEPLDYVLGRWALPPPRPHRRPPGADPAAGDRGGRRRRHRPRPRAAAARSWSPTSAPGRARSVCPSPTSCRSTASRCGSPTPATTPSTSPAPTSPASAGERPTCASPAGTGSTRCPPGRRSTSSSQPALRGVGQRRRRRVGAWRGSPTRRCSPGPTGSTTSARSSPPRPGWLRPGGWLVLEIGADQGDAVERLLVGRGYTDVAIRPDLAGRDRVAVARVPH